MAPLKGNLLQVIYLVFCSIRIHSAARLLVVLQPPVHHGLQDRGPDLPGGGAGQGQGEAEAPEGHVREDDSGRPGGPDGRGAQNERHH